MTFEEFFNQAEIYLGVSLQYRKLQVFKIWESQQNKNSDYIYTLGGLLDIPPEYEPYSIRTDEFEEKLRQKRIETVAVDCNIPVLFRYKGSIEKTIEKANKKIINFCKDYVDGGYNKEKNGLFIWGKRGIGKTIIGAAILQALCVDRAVSGRFEFFPSFLRKMKDGFSSKEKLSPSILEDCYLLVLDDVGSEYRRETNADTTWVDEVIFEIIDHRYRLQLPIVITSEKKPSELPYSQATIDRIRTVCREINLISLNNMRELSNMEKF